MKSHTTFNAATLLAALALSACTGADSPSDNALPVATALSPDGSRHIVPQFSPDGSRVAYWAPTTAGAAGWQLWVANADMTSPVKLDVTQLFEGIPAIWSPDGKVLAAVSSQFGSADVVTIAADGSAPPKRITTSTGVEAPSSWSPDGSRLAYFYSGNRNFGTNVITLSTGASVPLVPGEKRPLYGWLSPDGKHAVYVVYDKDKTTIWKANADGSNPIQLTKEGFELFSFNALTTVSWSPDAKEFLYESRRSGTTDIYAMPIDGGEPRQLTRDVKNDRGAKWSRDGKWVGFISERGNQNDVWVVPAAGGEARRVTDDALEQIGVAWSGATNELTYVTRSERGSVWTQPLTGGQARQLTPDSLRVDFFNLSPDGKSLSYLVNRGGGIADIAVGSADGGSLRTVLAGANVSDPRWSPDGTKIAFGSDRGGSADVWVVDVAGGAPRQLTTWPGFEVLGPWSADGSSIYFVSDHETQLGDAWSVPVAGGEPKRVTKDGTLGPITMWFGGQDLFVGTVSNKGALTWSIVESDGRVRQIWDRTAFSLSPTPGRDSVVVYSEVEGGSQAMMVPIRGGKARPILRRDEAPLMFSRDGAQLLYEAAVNGQIDLGVVHVASGEQRLLTSTPEIEAGAEWSPDGKTIVYRRKQIVQQVTRSIIR